MLGKCTGVLAPAPPREMNRLAGIIDRLATALELINQIKNSFGILEPDSTKAIAENPIAIEEKVCSLRHQAQLITERLDQVVAYLDTL